MKNKLCQVFDNWRKSDFLPCWLIRWIMYTKQIYFNAWRASFCEITEERNFVGFFWGWVLNVIRFSFFLFFFPWPVDNIHCYVETGGNQKEKEKRDDSIERLTTENGSLCDLRWVYVGTVYYILTRHYLTMMPKGRNTAKILSYLKILVSLPSNIPCSPIVLSGFGGRSNNKN